jgi:hypothetical protein
MRATGLGKNTYVDVLYIGAGDGKWNQIFRLASGGARMTTNAACLVNDFGPLHRTALWFFKHLVWIIYAAGSRSRPISIVLARAHYITRCILATSV